MDTVDSTSKNDLSSQWLTLLREEFQTERITDDEMCGVIRQIRKDFQYMIDPHTAVAFGAAQKLGYLDAEKPTVLLSTASPCKFEEAVTVAVGAEDWKKYYEEEFPIQGKATLELEEVKPISYKAKEGVPLEKSQEEWEIQARGIVAEFAKLGTKSQGETGK